MRIICERDHPCENSCQFSGHFDVFVFNGTMVILISVPSFCVLIYWFIFGVKFASVPT